MDIREEKDLQVLVERMVKSSKKIVKRDVDLQPHKPLPRITNRQELILRLLRIQEHIVCASVVTPRLSDEVERLLDKISLIVEKEC